jgi:arylsulfatase A-like enzyme
MGLVKTVRHDPKTGKDLLTSETNPVYAGMIETVDDSVGRVMEKLKEIGEYENTLFVFFSDNGSTTDTVPCVPLNGGKNSTYEAGVRVPAFMVWNGRIQPGSEYNHSIYIGDVFNTVMEASGQTPPANDSLSLMPVFAGEQLPPREYVWYFPDTRAHWAQRANAAIYDETTGMKFILFFTGDGDELYNITDDIGETTNLIDRQPEDAAKLKKMLIRFLQQNMDGMPPPPDKFTEAVQQRLEVSFEK